MPKAMVIHMKSATERGTKQLLRSHAMNLAHSFIANHSLSLVIAESLRRSFLLTALCVNMPAFVAYSTSKNISRLV